MRHQSPHRPMPVDLSTTTSAGQHDYHFRLEQASSPVNSPAQINTSTKANVFHGADESHTERIVTTPGNDFDEHNKSSSFDIVCPDGKDKERCSRAAKLVAPPPPYTYINTSSLFSTGLSHHHHLTCHSD